MPTSIAVSSRKSLAWHRRADRHRIDMSGAYLVHIRVYFKPGVHDPESETINRALGRLGFNQIVSLSAGKFFDVHIDAEDADAASDAARKMCETLLANPVIETYSIEIVD